MTAERTQGAALRATMKIERLVFDIHGTVAA